MRPSGTENGKDKEGNGMKEEIKTILKMLEDGKIDSEGAAELIAALREKKETAPEGGNAGKMFKVKVRSEEGDNVDVRLPINFVKSILHSMGKIPGIPMDGDKRFDIDLDMVAHAIEHEIGGKIVDVKSKNGDIVEVVIE